MDNADVTRRPEFLDGDDYPTDAALEKLRTWPFTDLKGWFEFAQSIWHWAPYGLWHKGRTYSFATGGWSGNESVLTAMGQNFVAWASTWELSRRGGFVKFRIPKGLK